MITKSSFVNYKCCQYCEHFIKNSAYNQLTWPITLENTRIKCKSINVIQLEIEKCCNKVQEQTMKGKLQYLKSKNKKINHPSENMMNILANLIQ
jgi:polynucleotide 5'-kinase involved in rRNA processing